MVLAKKIVITIEHIYAHLLVFDLSRSSGTSEEGNSASRTLRIVISVILKSDIKIITVLLILLVIVIIILLIIVIVIVMIIKIIT